jgi:hypothetical protein
VSDIMITDALDLYNRYSRFVWTLKTN